MKKIIEQIEKNKKEKEMKENIEKGKIVGVGLAAGAILGSAAGVLFAPKSGKETREDIKEAAEDLKEDVNGAIEEMKVDANEKISETHKKIGDTYIATGKKHHLKAEELKVCEECEEVEEVEEE